MHSAKAINLLLKNLRSSKEWQGKEKYMEKYKAYQVSDYMAMQYKRM